MTDRLGRNETSNENAELARIGKLPPGHMRLTEPEKWAAMPSIERASYDRGWLDACVFTNEQRRSE